MKLVMVAGFYPSVEEELKKCFEGHFRNRSIIWIPQFAIGREADVKRFTWAFFDRIGVGVRHILVILAIFRGRENIKEALLAVAREGYLQFADLNVELVTFGEPNSFGNPKSVEPLIERINAFDLPEPEPEPLVKIARADDLNNLEKWAKTKFPGKLVLHPRALRGARKSQYGIPSLIFDSLSILANEYRDTRMKGIEVCGDGLEKSLGGFDLHIGEAISDTSAGQLGDEYKIFYPPGQLRHRKVLTHHVKKGNDRDERTCLRIYFFWDENKSQVVVGWLPSHLETRSS